MSDWELSRRRIAGASRGSAPIVHVKARPKLTFFPGDKDKRGETTLGTIYVQVAGKVVASYEACGGPDIAESIPDEGGHSHDATPAGKYVLSGPERHTTKNWPTSVVPWGAPIRLRDDNIVEYQVAGQWRVATGPSGTVSQANELFFRRRLKKALKPEEKELAAWVARNIFEPNPKVPMAAVVKEWKRNDFGPWAFNMKKGGERTAYYVHTTPADELATEHNEPVQLAHSHGCIHIKPADRDEMMKAGYLAKGVEFEVRKYTDKGPP